jgi:hypothetical protein
MKCSFEITGTHKRMNAYPFNFGNTNHTTANNNHRTIKEVGAKSLYVSKKKFDDCFLYAIAYKGGKGRVATLITTDPKYNTWIYRKKEGSQDCHVLDTHSLQK